MHERCYAASRAVGLIRDALFREIGAFVRLTVDGTNVCQHCGETSERTPVGGDVSLQVSAP